MKTLATTLKIALLRERRLVTSWAKGTYKELLGEKKKRAQNTESIPEIATSPPPDATVIYFISGGSGICGTTYSTSKRHAKEVKSEKGENPTRTATLIQIFRH